MNCHQIHQTSTQTHLTTMQGTQLAIHPLSADNKAMPRAMTNKAINEFRKKCEHMFELHPESLLNS